MSEECDCRKESLEVHNQNRREFLASAITLSAGYAVLPLAGSTGYAEAAQIAVAAGEGFSSRAYAASSATSGLSPVDIMRRPLRPDDVLLDILYCGVCHSDIHFARGEWGPIVAPTVPGHEIIGRVRAVGNSVTRYKVGDIGGVGCMVDSCGTCDNCKRGLQQYCLNHKAVFTYDSVDPTTGKPTLGGYSDKIVVKEDFVIRIPPHADLAATAPLLCAGITTFSPMQHWKLAAGQRVGIIGLGGLGHVAVKLAVARKAEAIVFTSSPGKLEDAKRLGAKDAVLSSNQEALRRYANSLDLIIATVPRSFPMQPFIDLLQFDGTLVNLGALDTLKQEISGVGLALGRKSLAGSIIGGIPETQEVIDYCVSRNIKADIELIRIQDINKAFDRVVGKDVRYRFVIDMSSLA